MDQLHEQTPGIDDAIVEASQRTVAGIKRPATGAADEAEEDGRKRRRCTIEDDLATARKSQTRVQPDTPQTLFEGGLHIVFSFLDADEWIKQRTWLACRSWYAAALSMRSRRLVATVKTSTPVASPLALRHVTRLWLQPSYLSTNAVCQGMLEAACTGPLRDRLTEIRWSGSNLAGMRDFTLLMQLPKLDTLHLDHFTFKGAQSQVVKRLASLRKLTIRNAMRNDLVDLLAPPHSLHQLIDLEIEGYLKAPTVQLLVDQLPQLTRLNYVLVDPECIPLLGGLKYLREVGILQAAYAHFKFSEHISPHLTTFSQLRILSICAAFNNDDEVAQFAAAMPLIEDLTLLRGWGVTYSAVCRLLTSCPLLSRLMVLRRVSDVQSFTEDEIASLRPPSVLFPQLRHCVYEPVQPPDLRRG